ncbi:hypothetical protein ES332_A11G153500v1 [Gossypium tomentosum]|uniref:Uncharacterized protein n=1 Tax=Gossypium tomentosum TaxID=34277 RepID=A0A5D2NAM2_GOSTO|nr:hypothetical protein ES332_A11G153500v1 [Gossypium tomentosum]
MAILGQSFISTCMLFVKFFFYYNFPFISLFYFQVVFFLLLFPPRHHRSSTSPHRRASSLSLGNIYNPSMYKPPLVGVPSRLSTLFGSSSLSIGLKRPFWRNQS